MLKVVQITKEYEVPPFDCGESDIQSMMAEAYLATLQKQALAFNVFLDGIVVAQFMLTMSVMDDMNYTWSHGGNTFACVKIEYLAVAKHLQHRKIGTTVLKHTLKYIRKQCIGLPIRFILIKSVQDKVGWYSKYGFRRLSDGVLLKNQDEYTVPMCIDFMDSREVEAYTDSMVSGGKERSNGPF